jgi:large subunit ribosomal protein L21
MAMRTMFRRWQSLIPILPSQCLCRGQSLRTITTHSSATSQSSASSESTPSSKVLPESPQTNVPVSTAALAPLIHATDLYMTVHINSFPFLLSRNDTLHLPFHLPDAPLGSVLRMTRVSRIGTREYTLQGHPYVDPQCFVCKLRVVEHTKQPMVVTLKKKQRQRRTRHLPNKQNYTVLKYGCCKGAADGRVCEMQVKRSVL